MRALLCVVSLALVACQGEAAVTASVSEVCRPILLVPGAEDFAIAPTSPATRLFVSSQERRSRNPLPPGGIYSVTFKGRLKVTRRLPLAGRDGCSFHPHGIFLVAGQHRPSFLYVINHHDAEDASPTRGCFRLPADSLIQRRPVTSVEVFRVDPDRLVFLQRLAAPEVLTSGNDLVALEDGQIWVTNPPPSRLEQLLDRPAGKASKVVHFACVAGRPPLCPGTWREAARLDGFANGIAVEKEGGRLYVASTKSRSILVYTIDAGANLKKAHTLELDAYPDNLAWAEDGKSLLVAAHADLRRFFQHSMSPRAPSPSEVWQVPIDRNEPPERVFRDGGELVSAASTAACVGNDLFLGQVFGPGAWRCAMARACTGPAAGTRLVPGGPHEK